MRIGGASVKTAQLEIRPKHVTDKLQNPRSGDELLKNLAFVNEVCKTPRAGFLAEFRTGVFAFGLVEIFDALPDTCKHFVIEYALDNGISVAIQAFPLFIRHNESLQTTGGRCASRQLMCLQSRLFARVLSISVLLSAACFGQQTANPSQDASTAQQNAPSPDTATPQAATPAPAQPAAPAHVTPSQQPPPQEPYIIEDGGLSIEPIYWLNRAQPSLYGGAAATGFGNLAYPGNANPSLGGELSMPAGHSNTLRLTYFRAQGNANTTETQSPTIFGESYVPGDYLASNYTLQSAKLSWDYLSYTWYKKSGKIRLKTLYEVQFDTISTTISAPFKPPTTDSSGNTDYYIANGSKNLIYPTLGLEFEERLGHHFRWEAKGSGFGVPHHGDIWDAQADIAVRVGQVEILAGEKAYHFKTSTQADEYFTDTLSGAYVGLRYYWGRSE